MRLKSILVAALSGFLLVGCAASGSAPEAPWRGEDTNAGGSMDSAPQANPAPASGEGGPATIERQIARSAQITLKIEKIDVAATAVRQVAVELGGQVTSESLVTATDSDQDSVVVISVPSTKLDQALEKLSGVGEVVFRSIASQDVTTQVVDVNARIGVLEASIASLEEMGAKAGKVADLLEIERELYYRIAERDSLRAQQNALKELVDQSQIEVRLVTPARASELQTTGFMGGLQAGWKALGSAGQMALTIIGVLLPFAAVLAVIGVPLGWWMKRRRASKAAANPAPKEDS